MWGGFFVVFEFFLVGCFYFGLVFGREVGISDLRRNIILNNVFKEKKSEFFRELIVK